MASSKNDSTESLILKALAGVMKEVGVSGFAVLFLALVFLFYASAEQKAQFIDQYFLLKGIEGNPYPFFLLVIAMFTIIVVQNVYYRKRIELAERENKRIGQEKSELQALLLGKDLRSSQ